MPKTIDPATIRVETRLPKAEYDKLKRRADTNERSVARELKVILKGALKRAG